ncbi:heterokaryon incompatibility protein-domain-containing protein [Apiospora hydei]|uniref:Heterokaryon incompatibility protein-domain-containing protein n=1 Tax=Apiospora hydei TaxID=1337664 RepID=A0ABR1VX51_9PEZI
MDLNTYPYTPLHGDEIRYLVIHAFDESIGVVQCSLYHAPFHGLDNSFTALSYVWGDVNITGTIQLTEQPFSVTTNLRDCLRQFAMNPKYQERKLWVDAVCINQQDKNERNAQVQRMVEIYSNAESVIAWLGPGTHLSHVGMQRLQNVSLDEVKVMGPSTEHDVVQRRKAIWSELLEGYGEQGLQDLVLRPYWHRTWIIQEIALGRRTRLVCGDDEVAFENLKAVQWLIMCSLPFHIISTFRKEHQQSINRLSIDSHTASNIAFVDNAQGQLLDCVSKFAAFQCSDDKDKVYALLGLCRDAHHIVPDYNRPTAKVYGDVVEAHIKAHDNLYILNHVEYNSEKDRSCASWVPEWNRSTANPFRALLNDPEHVFQASRRLPLSDRPWSLDRDTESLHLTGACLDTISTLSTVLDVNDLTGNEVIVTALKCLHWIYQALLQSPFKRRITSGDEDCLHLVYQTFEHGPMEYEDTSTHAEWSGCHDTL